MNTHKILLKMSYVFECLYALLGVIIFLKLFGYPIEMLEIYEFMILKLFVIGSIIYVAIQISKLK